MTTPRPQRIKTIGWLRGINQPLILYYSAAYTLGPIGTVVVRLVRG